MEDHCLLTRICRKGETGSRHSWHKGCPHGTEQASDLFSTRLAFMLAYLYLVERGCIYKTNKYFISLYNASMESLTGMARCLFMCYIDNKHVNSFQKNSHLWNSMLHTPKKSLNSACRIKMHLHYVCLHLCISRPKCAECPLCKGYLLINFYLFLGFFLWFHRKPGLKHSISYLQSILVQAAAAGVPYLPDWCDISLSCTTFPLRFYCLI